MSETKKYVTVGRVFREKAELQIGTKLELTEKEAKVLGVAVAPDPDPAKPPLVDTPPGVVTPPVADPAASVKAPAPKAEAKS